MDWRSTTWARWLGWTMLYAVFFNVGLLDMFDVLPDWWSVSGRLGNVMLVLGPALIAFQIAVRFRSWWWGLGPLVACIVPMALLFVWAGFTWMEDPRIPNWAWLALWLALWNRAMIGGVSSLAALAGVWWGKRRESASF